MSSSLARFWLAWTMTVAFATAAPLAGRPPGIRLDRPAEAAQQRWLQSLDDSG